MDVLSILKRFYGYTSFRPNQQEIIDDVMQGNDCLVLMPTGGGKSLCYQIPALCLPGTAVVVSPLISLMRDQVEALKANGIPAEALNSGNDVNEDTIIRRKCLSGDLKLIYVSPERLLSEVGFLFKDIRISLFAIDEAHCISQWGHDFRPEYTRLEILHDRFPGIPVMALTATADKITRNDIISQLRLKVGVDEGLAAGSHIYVSSFDRPNLSLAVINQSRMRDKLMTIRSYILSHPGDSGIIYCLSRATTERVADEMKRTGISTEAYHAGLPSAERSRIQEAFKKDRIQVVAATIAFGMGIDKSNVRFVFHYNMPKSIENFYQEIGRAGRDGAPADTFLFYSPGDMIQLRRFAEESGQRRINLEKLQRMEEYATSKVCRRRILLNYFGELRNYDCHHCDVCSHPPRRFDGTIIVQKALSAIVRTGQEVREETTIEILRGIRSAKVIRNHYEQLKTFGAGADITTDEWKDYFIQMLQKGFIEIAYDEDNKVRITPGGNDVLYGKARAELAVCERKSPKKAFAARRAATPAARSDIPEVHLTPIGQAPPASPHAAEDPVLFDALRRLRLQLAEAQGFPAYIVFSDKVLHDLATIKPVTMEAFGDIPGIGDFKKQKYGEEFIRLIRRKR